ncbi:DUF438 domain-containing protein [Lentimicrobium sp.]|uniref:DUF438 domain-containing protein n=1 Tax=Lentimicrobium sp. TaxID=2034841 RepID=UPI002B5E49C9|nr:DUF438 domain-containing protein [Lentimicrobium sp.]
MSELINNSEQRKSQLKEIILKLHKGGHQEEVRRELMETLSQIPYGEVVEVEQELIAEGLPEEEVLRLCDAHSAVLQGNIDLSGSKEIPEGHPVDVFKKENEELLKTTAAARAMLNGIKDGSAEFSEASVLKLRGLFNNLYDADKHYQRKEYLLFPYLENKGITGPPKVMWGKQDEIRELIRGSIEILQQKDITREELLASAEIVFEQALFGIDDMTVKEEQILFPMAMDKLTDTEWYEISKQSIEIGFCLYDPKVNWKPLWAAETGVNDAQKSGSHIQLPSGSFSAAELLAILNTIPVDMTFVDKDDKVKYFTQGAERVFQRNRAILNRDVRLCHPPASAHIVDKIIDDFKSGRQSRAPFWINMGGKMVHIEYFALRGEQGEYLGVLEVSHDVTRYRELQGEQRILSYT